MSRKGWVITHLILLTLSRMVVAFQFQSITLLVDSLRATANVGPASFGGLLGIYMAPGAVVAIALPLLVTTLGARTTMTGALLLMAIGQLGLNLTLSLEVAYLWRLVAGAGGCVVYILAIDLAAQLCDAGRVPSRMGVVASSWPLGNALALVTLGMMVSLSVPYIAAYLPACLAVTAALCMAWVLRPRQNHGVAPRMLAISGGVSSITIIREWRDVIRLAFIPGLSFSLYNVSFIIYTSFTPDLLQSQGFSLLYASNIASLLMWLFVVSVPLGGILAGKSEARNKWLVGAGCIGACACILFSQIFQYKIIWYMLAGLLGGLPTSIMLAQRKSSSHKLFYSFVFLIFFLLLIVFPFLAGVLLEITGSIFSVSIFCIFMLIMAFFIFLFHRTE